ncbi:hypothetical protein B0T22DRAFT_93477 [Podospora appendiculata]|uniref:Extracellular serine-rich protein n=1 Tax=Podospora appendiculata TaxID=314037 RepID=A0AAE0XKP1_9PEZI|nr:hypothetical protein B0T22DRAFT_93477 [Podospora appendiculata]
MYASQVLGALLGAGLVAGQTPNTSGSAATQTTAPTIVNIEVGANGFLFTPNTSYAKVGDILRFNFYPGGHTVVRAAFKFPCTPYEYINTLQKGFYSGTSYNPQVISSDPPHFDVTVNDTQPIFFYCSAPNSCDKEHMIGVVNPNATQTFDQQMKYALDTQFQLAPGDPFPSEGATPTPSASSTSNSNDNGGGTHLSAGAIAGIAIGAAAVVVLTAALIYLCGRRGGFDKAYRKSVQPGIAPPPVPPPMNEGSHYAGSIGPKSPGQATFASYAVSGSDNNDPYRTAQSPPLNGYYNGTPPPMGSPGFPSPGFPSPGFSQPGYNGYQNNQYGSTLSPGAHTPLMGELQANSPKHSSPPLDHYQAGPVELPTADFNPGQSISPPPQYHQTTQPGRRDSWTTGEETQYRPGNK